MCLFTGVYRVCSVLDIDILIGEIPTGFDEDDVRDILLLRWWMLRIFEGVVVGVITG